MSSIAVYLNVLNELLHIEGDFSSATIFSVEFISFHFFGFGPMTGAAQKTR
jgi:hypothetical protein